MIKLKISEITNASKEIIDQVIEYTCAALQINEHELYLDTRGYIKILLGQIKMNNKKALQLRMKRDKVRTDLDDLERAFCNTSNSDFIEVGKNTGGRENNVEVRQLEKLKIKEKLGNLVLESLLLEKSLEKNNELIHNFLSLAPRSQYLSVLELTYIDCLSNTKIALEMGYTRDFVDQARKRGLTDLSEIIKCRLQNRSIL